MSMFRGISGSPDFNGVVLHFSAAEVALSQGNRTDEDKTCKTFDFISTKWPGSLAFHPWNIQVCTRRLFQTGIYEMFWRNSHSFRVLSTRWRSFVSFRISTLCSLLDYLTHGWMGLRAGEFSEQLEQYFRSLWQRPNFIGPDQFVLSCWVAKKMARFLDQFSKAPSSHCAVIRPNMFSSRKIKWLLQTVNLSTALNLECERSVCSTFRTPCSLIHP